MPAWAELDGKWHRVALIGVEHEDQRYVEWLEGPKHEDREYVALDRIRTDAPA